MTLFGKIRQKIVLNSVKFKIQLTQYFTTDLLYKGIGIILLRIEKL